MTWPRSLCDWHCCAFHGSRGDQRAKDVRRHIIVGSHKVPIPFCLCKGRCVSQSIPAAWATALRGAIGLGQIPRCHAPASPPTSHRFVTTAFDPDPCHHIHCHSYLRPQHNLGTASLSTPRKPNHNRGTLRRETPTAATVPLRQRVQQSTSLLHEIVHIPQIPARIPCIGDRAPLVDPDLITPIDDHQRNLTLSNDH
ncbi:hypothetical protein BCV69DRAFT_106566 [Microstroma glucosiphilum]|uniref:Uncharacterized protein n=1 Tax=Pseudomicrostroma glucosiphilum TaxID=1684307 RepID=A0A316UGK6_9BASI|nr:hypothetical protein BCV69DRAFT_106566 [Pseudomicrostroma glucosiphilum]PWN23053.1 hypothetical protein BCV69DRAFT_106566 [Pseudomicrostroma glucosiphilum]